MRTVRLTLELDTAGALPTTALVLEVDGRQVTRQPLDMATWLQAIDWGSAATDIDLRGRLADDMAAAAAALRDAIDRDDAVQAERRARLAELEPIVPGAQGAGTGA